LTRRLFLKNNTKSENKLINLEKVKKKIKFKNEIEKGE